MVNNLNAFYLKSEKKPFRVIKVVKDLSKNPYIFLCRYKENKEGIDLAFMFSDFKNQIDRGRIINKEL
jgi:hypothetical protein